MEFSSNQQYVHYSQSGFIYCFYIVEKTVYIDTIKNGKIYSTVKITENVTNYSVAIDAFGIFYLVSISSSGDLKYCVYKNNKWDCRYLTKYDAKSYRFKNLRIFVVNQKIHILVAISNIVNSELWTLKHHYWNKHTWINKKVCDMVIEKYDVPFHADIDPYNNIHIVFKSLSNKKFQVYYCKYSIAYNTWSIPLRISNVSKDNSHPFILCDNQTGAHIVWSSFYKNNLEIFYLYNSKINSSKNDWSEIKQLSNERTNSTHPFIYQVNNDINILWRQNNKYFKKSINILNTTWSESSEIQFDYAMKLSPISLIGNTYKSLTKVKILTNYSLFLNHDFLMVGLDHILPKDDFTSKIDKDLSALQSSKEKDENIPITKKSELEENTIPDTNHAFLKLLNTIQNIQTKQEDINTLLNNLKKQQEINVWKTDELTQLCSDINDHLKNTNNRLFPKIKNLFK
ncbi:hypothetical protein IZY60_14870 [Lutibacter sp. B2]|nr:hypothetical protein [Lutibacter sp. B2]